MPFVCWMRHPSVPLCNLTILSIHWKAHYLLSPFFFSSSIQQVTVVAMNESQKPCRISLSLSPSFHPPDAGFIPSPLFSCSSPRPRKLNIISKSGLQEQTLIILMTRPDIQHSCARMNVCCVCIQGSATEMTTGLFLDKSLSMIWITRSVCACVRVNRGFSGAWVANSLWHPGGATVVVIRKWPYGKTGGCRLDTHKHTHVHTHLSLLCLWGPSTDRIINTPNYCYATPKSSLTEVKVG